MRWRKRDLWKVGIAIAGMLLLLVLMAWIPVSAAGAEMRASGLAAIVTVQATPTEDATVTALNKEQLTQQVEQQQHTVGNWLWSNAATILSSFLSTLVVVAGLFFAFRQWSVNRQDAQVKELEDRKAEREKRAEERFQSAVEGLGSEREEAKVGAAILLRTFLHPGYEQFYIQTFDLAVAHLRLPRTPHPPENPNTALPLTTLSQALIVVFKEAFPLARSQNKRNPQSLDARGILLDNAFLMRTDLKKVWMHDASLRKALLSQADLNRAILVGADLNRAILVGADLSEADLSEADLSEADLSEADLSEADLSGANLSGANLSGANLQDTLSLKGANLYRVRGLTKEQLEACIAKGAIIDEDPVTSSPQPTVAASPSSQSNNVQAPSAPSATTAQGSTPAPETSESSAP